MQQGVRTVGYAEDRSASAAKAAVQGFRSDFVGVCWNHQDGRWKAAIKHDGTQHHLHVGRFDDEHEAARAFDAAARRLRPKGKAPGGRSGTKWLRLNFPTAADAYAARQGLPSAAGKSAAEASAAAQGFVSAFVGVR